MNPLLLGALVGAFVSGGFIALQAPTNALLARGVGSAVNAAFVSFLVGSLALLAVALALGARPTAGAMRALPWYAWTGGLYGAVFVTMAAWAAPRLGVTMFLAAAIAGQLALALFLDRMGAFGLARADIGPMRLLGVVLVLAGVVLVRR
ncbi:MAG TPA: DMT family transporter [Allosphingosinicella sp.]|nr:DMT family transporter [Allosphingosinicella sp.]